MLKHTPFYAIAAMALSLFSACSTFDCPLNNRVYASIKLAGDVSILEDTLTVNIPRSMNDDISDTVVVNLLTATDSLSLPMSYTRTEDMYLLEFRQKDTGIKTYDTIWVEKGNEPHFESVDCNPAMFHTIKGVKFTNNAIEDITINNNKVTYNDAKAHLLLYLKKRNN